MSIGGVVIQFRADSKQARRDIAKLNTSVASVGTTAKKTSGKGKLGSLAKVAGLGAVAGGAVGAAAGVVTLGKSIIQTSANFEQSQNILRAASDASAAEMKRLSETAKKMGASTVFSALDASDAMVELAKAGLSVDQIVGGGVQASMNLAATEGLALADSAVAVANAMSAFGLEASALPDVADALAGASKASTASVDSLMQALQQVGPGARTAGLSLEETVGVLAAFDNMGIKGSDAGTSLKTMLTRLVPQTNKAKDAFTKYGLAVYDAEKAQRELSGIISPESWGLADVESALETLYKAQGLAGAQLGKAVEGTLWDNAFQNQLTNADGTFKSAAEWAGVLQDALGKLGEVDLTEATNLLFGSDAGRAGGILASLGTEGLQPFLDGANEAGVAAELADARTEGLVGAMEALNGAWETLAIGIGETAIPALTDFVNYLSGTVLPAIEGTFIPAVKKAFSDTFGPESDFGQIWKWLSQDNPIAKDLRERWDRDQRRVTRDDVRKGALRQGELANAYRYGSGSQVPTNVTVKLEPGYYSTAEKVRVTKIAQRAGMGF